MKEGNETDVILGRRVYDEEVSKISRFLLLLPQPLCPRLLPWEKEHLRPVLFEKGYHDRIINRPGMLENIKRYMQENPLRARIREECQRLMERQLHLWISGREYAAFGMKYPIKEQVFFHRKDPQTGLPTEQTEAYRQEHDRLLRIAEEGTVLVTPGISKGESLVVNVRLFFRNFCRHFKKYLYLCSTLFDKTKANMDYNVT